MKYLLLALLCMAQVAHAQNMEITSASSTPTVQYVGDNLIQGLTLQVTVGAGDTCLVEFSNTPSANVSSNGNWQPVNSLSSITANASQNLPTNVNSVRLTRTAGTSTCVLDIGGYIP